MQSTKIEFRTGSPGSWRERGETTMRGSCEAIPGVRELDVSQVKPIADLLGQVEGGGE